MNSPWGYYQYIVKETGWTMHYVLWKVSEMNIRLMMADKPAFKSKSKQKKELNDNELLAETRTETLLQDGAMDIKGDPNLILQARRQERLLKECAEGLQIVGFESPLPF